MTCNQLLRHYKTKAAIAAAIGASRQRVHGWFERDTVPVDVQIKYEVATGGALKADVPAEFRARTAQVAA